MIKASVVLAIGLALAALLRGRSAALRHWLLAATIACAAATPALERVVPTWRLPASAGWLGAPVAPLTLTIPVGLVDVTAPAADDPRMGSVAAAPINLPTLLAIVRTGGMAIGVVVLMIGFLHLAWLTSRARPIEAGAWSDMARRLSTAMTLEQPIRLLLSDHPTLLVTWGARRPAIVVPRGALSWPADRIRIVLAHELAHIQRRDWPVQIATQLFLAVHWFNPLAWIACRRLRLESEQACDDRVLAVGVEGADYASHLLALATAYRRSRSPLLPAPAMARRSSLERRIRAMLSVDHNRSPLSRPASIVIVLALAAITVPMAGLAAVAQTSAASFSGSLVDAVGRVLPEVTLVLSNAATHERLVAKSDESGRFAFAGVPPADYDLLVEKPGFAATQGRISLGPGETLTRDVALQIGQVHETVTITSTSESAPPPATLRAARPDLEPDPCSQTTVGGCLTPPRKLVDVKPVYPASPRDNGIAGLVELDGRIGTDGFVKDLRLTQPADPDFARAAVAAVERWEFTATRLDGVPLETDIHVTVNFVIR